MNLREAAATIKQSVTMKEAAEFYGFIPNRAGYIHCPFHAGDNQGSLKVYSGQRGFCCFGCGEKGSVIDFVMKLYDISFSSACERISNDFSLDLPIGRQMTRREKEARKGAILAARAQAHELTRKQTDIDQKFWAAFDLWCVADLMRIRYCPERAGGKILPGYINAVRDLPLLANNLTQAEIERWKFEQATKRSGLEQRNISDSGAV